MSTKSRRQRGPADLQVHVEPDEAAPAPAPAADAEPPPPEARAILQQRFPNATISTQGNIVMIEHPR